MTLLGRRGNLIALRTNEGEVLGFHTLNLELAQLTPEASRWIMNQEVEAEAKAELEAWDSSSSQQENPGLIPQKIRNISINITQICNLHCTYCAAGGDGTYGRPTKKIAIEKTIPQLAQLLAQDLSGPVHINFIGGEPLLYPEALDLIASYLQEHFQLSKVNLKFVVTTNGTLLNEKILATLTRHKVFVNVSLDGAAEINDQRRPQKNGQGSTDLVLENLSQLSRIKQQLGGLGVTAVFDRHNPHAFAAWEFLRQLNTDWLELNFSHTEMDDSASKIFSEELSQVAAAAYRLGGEKELRRIKAFDHYFHQLDSQQKVQNFCGAGKSLVVIDAQNDVYPCPWMVGDTNEKLGSDGSLSAEKLSGYAKPLITKSPCSNCWARFLCGGGCMYIHKTKTGSKTEVDPNFCERTKNLITTTLLYYDYSRRGNEVLNETH